MRDILKLISVLCAAFCLGGCIAATDAQEDEVSLGALSTQGDAGTDDVSMEETNQIVIDITLESSGIQLETEEETESWTEMETGPDEKNPLYVLETGRSLSENVKNINEVTAGTWGSGVENIFEKKYTAETIKKMVLSYSFPEGKQIDGHDVSQEEMDDICANRNLDGIDDSNAYGLLTVNADVRSFPTDERITDADGWDYLQETKLRIMEPVAVLHSSADGRYSFVQGLDYFGWIKTEYIQECSRELAYAVWTCGEYAVITDSLCSAGEYTLRMGTVLPAVKNADGGCRAILVCSSSESDGYMCLEDEGMCIYEGGDKEPESEDFLYVRFVNIFEGEYSESFINMDEENFQALSEKLFGCAYSWGDENEEGYDCSSSIAAVYRCFGVILPRNSGIMKYSGLVMTDLSGMTPQEKRTAIMSMPKGTIVHVSGHVMMYMGTDDSGTPLLYHSATGYVDESGSLINAFSYVKTSLDIHTRGTSTYLEIIDYVLIPEM